MKQKIILFCLLVGFAACSTDEDLSNDVYYDNFDTDFNNTSNEGNLNNSTADLYEPGGEQYNEYVENEFISVANAPISTFSVDADGASYSNVRRLIDDNIRPPAGAVRIEELINFFPLDYPEPTGNHPIALNGEISACPWTADNRLVRIGIQGQTIPTNDLEASNIVLLVDVSGSMSSPDKLGLLQEGFKMLVDGFDASDRIAIVTYAGKDKLVLEATPGDEKQKIKDAIDALDSGGGTAGAAGIETAYEIATANFVEGGNNRIIIGTDGDFNIGPSSQDELVTLIEEKRESGIFITVLGVGSGNYNDAMLEQIANNGNGTYEYIDNTDQTHKVFVQEFGKFYAVAKDVKVQVEFNPETVESYRLIGYENRILGTEDFEDDEKDAGEIGSGQNITALYEIVPVVEADFNREMFTIDFRYKKPDEDQSTPLSLAIKDSGLSFEEASENLRFVSSVAGLGMLLIDSKHKGDLQYQDVIDWTNGAKSFDPFGHRVEFTSLALKAKNL